MLPDLAAARWRIEMTTGGTGPVDAASEEVMFDPARGERKKLIQLCLYALDRARSAGVAERIVDGLAGVGVTPVRPDGERFDPAVHEAGGTQPTDDPALAGLVAETEVVGFLDHGQPVRPPVVTVYTLREAAG
ncbi:nucleotide exchange factor GrpE [Crossiella sp. SN42]|uniref:nucleotide exchange factor GrpE n=1 Tax=Crossiella sp. SN42 TaxID=2944808 RepID=UPI0035AB87F6